MSDQSISQTGGIVETDASAAVDGTAAGTAMAMAAEAATTGGGDEARTASGTARAIADSASAQVRTLADTGKARASGALGDFARMLDDAAGQVDEALGERFGGYARQASGAVQNFADGLDGKDLDELVEDVKAFVQKSPAVAIGTAAALGFVVARVLRSGIDANRA